VNLRKLKTARSAVLVLGGISCVVAGIWVLAAVLFSPEVGVGVGLVAAGLGSLLTELVSE
jgi:hypothetical protein